MGMTHSVAGSGCRASVFFYLARQTVTVRHRASRPNRVLRVKGDDEVRDHGLDGSGRRSVRSARSPWGSVGSLMEEFLFRLDVGVRRIAGSVFMRADGVDRSDAVICYQVNRATVAASAAAGVPRVEGGPCVVEPIANQMTPPMSAPFR